MGTRSTTKVFYEGKFVFGLYRQYDGYLSGHGKDIVEFMEGHALVNGIRSQADGRKIINGPQHFGIALIDFLLAEKSDGRGAGGGNFYTTNEEDEQEYNYRIDLTRQAGVTGGYDASYSVTAHGKTLLSEGSFEDFKNLVDEDEE